jgi:hypothetical protein
VTKYDPEYEGIMPGPGSHSIGHYLEMPNNVIRVMTELTLGRLPIILGDVNITLPSRGTDERFPWTAQFVATSSKTKDTYFFDGIVNGDRAYVQDIKQDHPFKWGAEDTLVMYTMYIKGE